MGTIVLFHAHPDDEVTSTGGTIATLSRAGHRVIVVTATDGSEGEVPDGCDRSELAAIRSAELAVAAEVLGVHRSVELGYADSGMDGEESNQNPRCFARVDVDEAAGRLASILTQESADALTIYDDHGGYGHPDHVAVHHVGIRAAEMAGVQRVYEATMNRDAIQEMMAQAGEHGLDPEGSDDGPTEDEMATIGMTAAEITHHIDVADQAMTKRTALVAHSSQVSPDSFFLAMPDELFAMVFGTESYRSRDGSTGTVPADLLPAEPTG